MLTHGHYVESVESVIGPLVSSNTTVRGLLPPGLLVLGAEGGFTLFRRAAAVNIELADHLWLPAGLADAIIGLVTIAVAVLDRSRLPAVLDLSRVLGVADRGVKISFWS